MELKMTHLGIEWEVSCNYQIMGRKEDNMDVTT